MNISTSRIRAWLVSAALLVLLALPASAQGIDLNKNVSAQSFTVSESAFTTLTCPLQGANNVQVIIAAGGEQIFTFRNTNGTTVPVPSGASFRIGTLRGELTAGQVIGAVQTATGAATVVVIAQRVQ